MRPRWDLDVRTGPLSDEEGGHSWGPSGRGSGEWEGGGVAAVEGGEAVGTGGSREGEEGGKGGDGGRGEGERKEIEKGQPVGREVVW